MDDHSKHCYMRQTVCTCGYENEREAAIADKDVEIERYRNALETIAINMHGSNPSLPYADAPREDYLAHVLWEARQLARAALKGDAS